MKICSMKHLSEYITEAIQNKQSKSPFKRGLITEIVGHEDIDPSISKEEFIVQMKRDIDKVKTDYPMFINTLRKKGLTPKQKEIWNQRMKSAIDWADKHYKRKYYAKKYVDDERDSMIRGFSNNKIHRVVFTKIGNKDELLPDEPMTTSSLKMRHFWLSDSTGGCCHQFNFSDDSVVDEIWGYYKCNIDHKIGWSFIVGLWGVTLIFNYDEPEYKRLEDIDRGVSDSIAQWYADSDKRGGWCGD